MSQDRSETAATPFWRAVPFIIVCGSVVAMASFGPRSSMGLFLAPMTETRGWSRETFALAIAIQNLLWGLGQPIAGGFADRYGTTRVLIAGALLTGAALILMPLSTSPFMFHLSAGVLFGLGLSACSFSIVLAAFGRIVSPARRSIAFGIGTAAGSFGQFLFAPLGQALIDTQGWQNALQTLGFLTFGLIFLFSLALKGKPWPQPLQGSERDQTIMEALSEALRHPSYLLLVAGFFVCGFHLAFVTVHLPAYLIDRGLDPVWGGWSIACIGLFNIIGALAAGQLGQRHPKQIMLVWIYLARAALIVFFVLTPISPVTVLIFSAALGLLWLATVPPTSGLVAVMFGPRYMAMLFGVVFLSHQIGSFIGVWLGGRLYDTTGSYDVVWWISVALGLFAAAVHWPIKEQEIDRPIIAAAP
ncbi:MFS transporter [Breoghania sp.]|uniref:MFS transporter n=1 Tax=Breoghania sp. TaxID=2065378 RepID=UPI0029CA3C01|nr:MFS transporter [Breoghania sp.]